ncbi:hypothetical protein [Comamonas terrigena]|uniref:hypothetical protein n=1 Tax=Comamonas terrigena TaxID=32013 RepID=UPI00244BE7E8|nr:hypothetical protein [Comamonas terrigena]MDH1501388.1 hypothetical protein [Comamonas terrigena]
MIRSSSVEPNSLTIAAAPKATTGADLKISCPNASPARASAEGWTEVVRAPGAKGTAAELRLGAAPRLLPIVMAGGFFLNILTSLDCPDLNGNHRGRAAQVGLYASCCGLRAKLIMSLGFQTAVNETV